VTPLHRSALLLELDLTSSPIEVEPEDLVGKLRSRQRPRLRGILRALHEAGDDHRVRGLIVKLGGGALSWATVQELRAGLQTFAKSGKPVVAWAETFGEGRNGSADYLLASGCTEIWLQPTGEFGLMGVAVETTFLRGALDKLGIEPQLDKRYEYKNAADRVMEKEFTPAHREAIDRVVASIWETAVAAIAEARSVDESIVEDASARAPISAQQARAAGLVDRLGYRDEVYADVRGRVGKDVALLFADQWSPRRSAAALIKRHREVVALVEGHGEITLGRSRSTPRGPVMGSNSVAAALRAAR
jgi:protease-4